MPAMSEHEAYIHARAKLPQAAIFREMEGRHPEAGDRVTWINRGQQWFGKIREYQPDHDRWLVVADGGKPMWWPQAWIDRLEVGLDFDGWDLGEMWQ